MLDRLRDRLEEHLEALARERLHPGAPGLVGVYRRAGDLFHPDRIAEAQLALAGAAGEEEKRARFLLEALVRERAAAASAAERERYLAWHASATVTVGERRVPLADLPGALAGAADRELRWSLAEAGLAALAEQDALLEGVHEREREVVEEVGYGGYLESWQVLAGVDLLALAREGERFLAETDAAYHDLLAWYLPRVADAAPGEAREADAPRLEAAPLSAALFAERDPLWRVEMVLREGGLDPRAGGRVRVEARPDLPWPGGARCHPLRVPFDVLLATSPRAGRAAHAALLHQLGVAMQRASADPDLPMELRWLGDASVPDAFGHLLRGLLASAPWLARVHSAPREALAEERRYAALLDLLRVRREVALLQLALDRQAEPDRREREHRYVELLTRATGLRHDARGAPAALGPAFQPAWRLRAELLHPVVALHLRERLDEDWFRNPRAADLLRPLLAAGQSFTAAELAERLGAGPLGFGPLQARLAELWG